MPISLLFVVWLLRLRTGESYKAKKKSLVLVWADVGELVNSPCCCPGCLCSSVKVCVVTLTPASLQHVFGLGPALVYSESQVFRSLLHSEHPCAHSLCDSQV